MAKTSFGSTDLKKVSIGGTTIKKISIGETIVYTSAEPFCVVQDNVCKQALTWTRVDSENDNVYTSFYGTWTWNVGDQAPEVAFSLLDDSKGGSATYKSTPIDTKGNNTLYIKPISFNYNYNVRINDLNGKRYGQVNGEATIDISGLSTIVIYLDISCFAYNNPHVQLGTMKLY